MQRHLPFLLGVALLLAACSSQGAGGGTSSRCNPADAGLIAAISEGLTVAGGGYLANGQIVKSNDFSKIYFVAADIQGVGMEGREIRVWATNGTQAGEGLIFAVNSLAKEFSDWGPGDTTDAHISMTDDGARRGEVRRWLSDADGAQALGRARRSVAV